MNKDAIESELMAAVLFCFKLESYVFEFKDKLKSRNDVYEFFRQGFGPTMAEKLTDNLWVENKIQIKPGDKIMGSPDPIFFRSISQNSAVISFKTPESRKQVWGNSDITVLVFKKEDDSWKLFEKK